ncbi:hypothetical protein EV122DRAFT_269387 [Schizophyllum commune]
MAANKRISYYYDPDVGSYTYGLGHPMKPHRMRVTHELVSAYGMLDKMHILRAKRASPGDMTRFHTDEYVDFLNRVTPETAEDLTYQGTRFLVGDDNPAFEGVFEFCSISAGGSLAAAQRISSGSSDICINWSGGLHHAKKREASGFCYINDIVLCILDLLRTHPRVLYVDIDCHHGDGVEEAFYTTDRVMTCSFHKFGEYFPGTGTQDDRGHGKGKGYAVNVPLKDGITDDSYQSIFEPVVTRVLEVFGPSVVVLQCGSDSLSGDKLGCFNLSMEGHARCVQFFRKQNIPLIMLGGGGYTVKNVARTWTYETACALGIEDTIDPHMPWNEYFEWFGPRYRLEVVSSNMEDMNLKDNSLNLVREKALQHLAELAPAPSVQMHDVPRESVGKHLRLAVDDEDNDDERDDLDRQLAQHMRYVYNLHHSSSAPPSPTSSTSSSDSDSDSSAPLSSRPTPSRMPRSSPKKRMSILTNRYHDPSHRADANPAYFTVPCHDPAYSHFACGAPAKASHRRFFQSGAHWDAVGARVVLPDGAVFAPHSGYGGREFDGVDRRNGALGVGLGMGMETGFDGADRRNGLASGPMRVEDADEDAILDELYERGVEDGEKDLNIPMEEYDRGPGVERPYTLAEVMMRGGLVEQPDDDDDWDDMAVDA